MTDQKPREFWIIEYVISDFVVYTSDPLAGSKSTIHVREVMPDDDKRLKFSDAFESKIDHQKQQLDRLIRALDKAKDVILKHGVHDDNCATSGLFECICSFGPDFKKIEAIETGDA